MRPSRSLESNIPSDTFWRLHLVCKKIHAYTSSKSLQEYNQKQTSLTITVRYDLFMFVTNLGVMNHEYYVF